MTNLIYRTVSHTGAKSTAPRAAQTLMYRGVAHDGLAEQAPKGRAARMCYRGVLYTAQGAHLGAAAKPARGVTLGGAVAA